MAVLERVLAAAAEASVLTIADAKRGDIGSTMAAYADAWLRDGSALAADSVTLSPYLGFESLRPALDLADLAAQTGRGVFVLALTSNPEGASVQHVGGADSVARRIVRAAAAENLGAIDGGSGFHRPRRRRNRRLRAHGPGPGPGSGPRPDPGPGPRRPGRHGRGPAPHLRQRVRPGARDLQPGHPRRRPADPGPQRRRAADPRGAPLGLAAAASPARRQALRAPIGRKWPLDRRLAAIRGAVLGPVPLDKLEPGHSSIDFCGIQTVGSGQVRGTGRGDVRPRPAGPFVRSV